MRNLKLTLIMSAVLATALTACGGGSSDDGVDNSAMTLTVTPSADQNIPANSTTKVSMSSSVRRASSTDTNSVASMTWTVTPLNGETVNPTIADANCDGMNSSGPSASCSSILSIPQTVTTGKWNVVATAKASNGTQRSQSFTLSVNNSVYQISAGDAQTINQETNGTFGSVSLKGSVSQTNGGKLASVQWTQVSGPDTPTLANSGTLTPSFTPTSLGTYTFKFQAIVDDVTLNATTTVAAQPKSN